MKTLRKSLKHAMEKPLIVGASVSGDYLTESPGKRLALRHTRPDQIQVIARRGTPGREILKQLSSARLADRTSIICVDTFFWDSLAHSPEQSLRALETLADFARDHQIPLILAEVPALLEALQPSARRLNEQISRLAETLDQCYVLPLNAILQKAFCDGSICQGGRTYELAELIPDGLHISAPASEFLADRIAELFDEAF